MAGDTSDTANTQNGSSNKDIMSRPLPRLTSPTLAQERKQWTKLFLIFVTLLVAIILGILSIYWGADHSLQFNLPVVTVAIIDFDNGEVGPFLQNLGQESRRMDPSMTLGYISQPGSLYNYSMINVRSALKDERFWFAIVAQQNATTAMNYVYSHGNTSYDPTGSVHVLFEESRNVLAIDEFALPSITSFMGDFQMKFTKQKQMSLLNTNRGNADALARQAQTPVPIAYSLYNTAPYVPSTAEAATEIGTIYLIIISFLTVLMLDNLHESTMGKISPTTYYIYRLSILPILYLFLSALYLILSIMWQIRFDKFYGASGYVIYWILSWSSMLAFGLAVENVNNFLGPPFTPVFFVFWVITNVATGFYPIELLSNFYRWGLAWPLRHTLIAAKAIIFGTKNLMGQNFGVLWAWVGFSLLLQPISIWVYLRRKRETGEKHRKEILEREYGQEKNGGEGQA